MTCTHCGSNNVTVTIENIGSKTKIRKRSFLGSFMRLILICCTGGLWLLVGKRTGVAKTKSINRKIALCQQCGASWEI
jgi:protein-arginine kinase activator protein McsA